MKREFVKSGIPGLDKITGGGLLAGSVVTLSGPTGSGKSTFAMQFLVEGALKFKEPGVYIAIEESKDAMYFHMSGYAWDLEKMEKARQLVFLDYPVYEVDQFMNQYSAILEIINSVGARRVVIDSIMPIALFFPNEEERKKGFLKFIDNIRKWNTTTLIVSEDTTSAAGEALPETKYGIETFTDAWIHIYTLFSEKTRERTREVEVLKLKGAAHSTRRYPATIDKNGISILVK